MELPDGITLQRHRELEGRERRPLVRWILIGLLCLVLLLALVNVFGQWPVESEAATAFGTLEVDAPRTLRGGLLFQARFVVDASSEIEQAVLVLDPGWLEDITLNTVEPAPVGEASRDGKIALDLGRIPAGDEHRLYLHFQVNPTAVGRRSQDVSLYDGERELGKIERTAFIWP
ncbi:MAG TPA: hypothetical protein VEW90_07605 [Gaiellaceae bacterium]|nr:hypothetical protein [Gaiellaceae bacterium]